MEENENTSSQTLADEEAGSVATPSEGQETVSDNISLEELSEVLGSNFKTKEDALKSVKETKNFVGKRKEDIIAEAKAKVLAEVKDRGIDTSNFVTKEELEEEKFYAANQNLAPYKSVINAVKKDKGISLEEAIKLEELKPFVQTDSQKSSEKSVLMSNNSVRTNEPTLIDLYKNEKNPQRKLEMLAQINEERRRSNG